MKHKILIKKIMLILPFMLSILIFFQTSIKAEAYTQEEIEAAKAWLSANGYSPDAGGAAAAYQDYLNGKFGPVPGQESTDTTDNDNTPATSDGVENPAATEESGSSEAEEQNGNTGKNGSNDKNSKDKDSQENGKEQTSQTAGSESNQTDTQQGQGTTGSTNQDEVEAMSTEQMESMEALLKQIVEETNQSSSYTNQSESSALEDSTVSENSNITNNDVEPSSKETEDMAIQNSNKEQAKEKHQKAFYIWLASFAGIILFMVVIYYWYNGRR